MNGMTQGERKATTALASIFALRMLGLFMIVRVGIDAKQRIDRTNIKKAGQQ